MDTLVELCHFVPQIPFYKSGAPFCQIVPVRHISTGLEPSRNPTSRTSSRTPMSALHPLVFLPFHALQQHFIARTFSAKSITYPLNMALMIRLVVPHPEPVARRPSFRIS